MTDFSVPMPARSSLKRSSKRIKPKRKPQVRVGKVSGTVRLSGAAMERLRADCYWRDGGICQECGVRVHDLYPDWHPRKYHMAHIIGRGAGGGDVLSNVRTLCGEDHREEHGNPKPATEKLRRKA